jgi:hypothetical protein
MGAMAAGRAVVEMEAGRALVELSGSVMRKEIKMSGRERKNKKGRIGEGRRRRKEMEMGNKAHARGGSGGGTGRERDKELVRKGARARLIISGRPPLGCDMKARKDGE